MKRLGRSFLAFTYLTVGYWFFNALFVFLLLVLPFVRHDGGGISHSALQGVHQVTFQGERGTLLLVYVSETGSKSLSFTTAPQATSSSQTYFRFTNLYGELLTVGLFALISIPVLRRLLTTPAPMLQESGPKLS